MCGRSGVLILIFIPFTERIGAYDKIYPKKNTNSNMVLIEGKKNGKPGLIIKEPLFVHDENGNYLEEINKLFFRR